MFTCDIYSRGTGSLDMLGSLAIVTFYSDSSVEGKGFLMFYEAFTNTTTEPIASFSTNIILSETPDAYLTYPGDNYNYRNDELSTFVYSPDHSYENSFTVQADCVVNSLENPCYDFVTVYKFNGSGWSNVDK
jgi:hypothetical protein